MLYGYAHIAFALNHETEKTNEQKNKFWYRHHGFILIPMPTIMNPFWFIFSTLGILAHAIFITPYISYRTTTNAWVRMLVVCKFNGWMQTKRHQSMAENRLRSIFFSFHEIGIPGVFALHFDRFLIFLFFSLPTTPAKKNWIKAWM